MQNSTHAAGVSVAARSGPAMKVSVNIRAAESRAQVAEGKMDHPGDSWAARGGLGPWKISMKLAAPQLSEVLPVQGKVHCVCSGATMDLVYVGIRM